MWNNPRLISRIAYLVTMGAIAILIYTGIYYFINRSFVLSQIHISGAYTHMSEQDINYITQYCANSTLFNLDIAYLTTQIKAISWVESIVIAKHFPNSLDIKVTKKVPVAKLSTHEFITASGEIFSDSVESSSVLPMFRLDSLSSSATALSLYHQLNNFTRLHKLSINTIYVSNDGIIGINFTPELSVWICSTDYTARLSLLDKIYNKLVRLKPNLNYINMCYKNAVAVKQQSFVMVKP